MEQLSSFDSIHPGGSWITIGSFDGVHLGHKALISRLVKGAHHASLSAAVITFEPHPAVTLGHVRGLFYLASPEEKAANLAALGVDVMVTLPFDHQMTQWTAEFFMERLVNCLQPRRLLTGPGFALGRNREGSLERLAALGKRLGYSLEVVQPWLIDKTPISSSRVRELLLNHEIEQAARLLGRNYKVTGKVVPGDGRGRLIGIPTANIQIHPQRLLPGNGVYATFSSLPDGERFQSVSNIGVRPTFENENVQPRLETHLLDVNRDFYGQIMEVEFASYLRSEQRFSSIDQLVHQIQQDITRAKEILGNVT